MKNKIITIVLILIIIFNCSFIVYKLINFSNTIDSLYFIRGIAISSFTVFLIRYFKLKKE